MRLSTMTGVCLLVAAVLILPAASPAEAQEPPQTSVIILVDMSASFAPLIPEDRTALESLADAIVRMTAQQAEGWEQPVKLMWAVIGSSSMKQTPPCGPAIQFRGMIAGRRPGVITRADSLRIWFKACVLRLMGGAAPPERYTDISGAVALASEVARQIQGLKVVFMLSDFAEDLPPGDSPARFALRGEHVVLLYRPDARSRQGSDQVLARVREWETRLRGAGASSVCRLPIKGITAGSVEACLSS